MKEETSVTIYLDAIFILNLLFNFLILLLVQSLVRHETSRRRIFFGAFIATLFVPLTIYFPHTFFTSFIGKIFFSVIIIFCSFTILSFKQFLKLFFSFYFISFGIGGGLIALYYLMNETFVMTEWGILTYNTGFGDVVSWLFVIIAFPIVLVFTKWRMDRHMIDQIRFNEIYDVTIKINDKQFKTNGFIDSGNQLIDPVTRVPVVICDEHFLKQFFNEAEWELLKKAYHSLDVELIPKRWRQRTFVVPFKGVAGSSNILFAIKPDVLTVHYDGKTLMTKRVLIGVQFSQLTDDLQYHCLLHPNIVHTATVK